jgi:hypothetical protein
MTKSETELMMFQQESLTTSEHMLRLILMEEVQQRLSADRLPPLPPEIDAHSIEPFVETLVGNPETRDESREFFRSLLAEHRDKMNKVAAVTTEITDVEIEICNVATEMLNKGKSTAQIIDAVFGSRSGALMRYQDMLDGIKEGKTPREAVKVMLKLHHDLKGKNLRGLLRAFDLAQELNGFTLDDALHLMASLERAEP